MHIDFALPIDGDLEEGLKAWQRKAERSVMDYSFHMAITTWNDKVRLTRGRGSYIMTITLLADLDKNAKRAGCKRHGDAGGRGREQLQVLHGIQGSAASVRRADDCRISQMQSPGSPRSG